MRGDSPTKEWVIKRKESGRLRFIEVKSKVTKVKLSDFQRPISLHNNTSTARLLIYEYSNERKNATSIKER